MPWSSPPYGYRVDPQAPRDPAGLAVDAERAAVVGQVFAWYVEEGLTLHAIARRLTAAGAPTATGRPSWGPTSVGGILRNTSYRGVAYGTREQRVPARRRYPLSGRVARPSGGVSAHARPADVWIAVPVPALVTPELFAAAQERLARNRAWSPRNTQGEYLLRRLVSCRRCGRAACVSNNGRYAYYRCLPRAGDGADEHQARCQEQSVPTGALDAAVWADLRQVLNDPAVLAEAVRRAQAGWLNDDARTARQHDLRQRRATLERQRQRLIDAYAAEAVTLEELQTRVRALEGRLTDLTRDEQQLATSAEQQAQIGVLVTQVEAFRATIAQGLDQASFARRRELVELLIDRVLVAPPEVEIRYIVPFGGAAHRKVVLQSGHRGATCRQSVAADGAGRWRRPGRICGTTGAPSRRSRSRRVRPAAPPRRGS